MVHRIFVTHFRGCTDVVLELNSRKSGRWVFLTSPSGALERAWHWSRKAKTGEVSHDLARDGFEHALDFWMTKVEPGTGRWPFQVKAGYDPTAAFAALSAKDSATAAPAVRGVAEKFLRLPLASATEQALLTDAFSKLGLDHDHWAYRETSRGLEDKRIAVTRVDPSQPEAGCCVLLSIDGKPPTSADIQRWRDNAEFPAEKFQALFRVNKTRRSFEDITVKMRESLRVAGVVRIIDAGLYVRFQSLDPDRPPQPVVLKGGGAARILLVKISRDVEATRTDFRRVEPYVEPESAVGLNLTGERLR